MPKFACLGLLLGGGLAFGQDDFRVEEASIRDIQRAIQEERTTCREVVQTYLARARAYNGVCTALVTEDGAPIAPAAGSVRAGAKLSFPTETVAVTELFPDYESYVGPPLELGRMVQTASDPSAQQQYGMRVGIPNAGQLNALETINIRGERSVTCSASCDAHPSTGALPASCPVQCDAFRQQPDALERATELDERYGSHPDLETMPMYCAVFSWKNWFDAKDMRSTGGVDVNFAMDVPPDDSPDVALLREKGAISFAMANAMQISLSESGAEKPSTVFVDGARDAGRNYAYGSWGGQPCNPYDTERVPRGSSSGSGVSVAANLVTCSLCEQSGASCKGPASRNNVVNLLTTKGLVMHGGLNNQNTGDRAGINCRTVEDVALVLDAVKGYKSGDVASALPHGLIPEEPYASHVVHDEDVDDKPLAGMRVAVVREFMVKHTKNDVDISDQIDGEIKTVLRDKLGAELVESIDPLYPDDPSVPNMTYTFEDAFAEILPQYLPEYFWQTTDDGELAYAVPGWDVRTVDYAVALGLGKAPLSPEIGIRTIARDLSDDDSPLVINKYLAKRGDARVKDWASWVENAIWISDAQRAGAVNAVHDQDHRADPDGVSYIEMHTVLRMIVLKVMYENGIDAFVNPEITLPPFKIGGPVEPAVKDRSSTSCCSGLTAVLGSPEIEVPAGYTNVIYEPKFVLSRDKTRYDTVTGESPSAFRNPMPISLMVWAGPGSDAEVIKIASAYEAATHHRVPPPDFGPVE